MNARWTIQTVDSGMNLVYENLVDNIVFECGIADRQTNIIDLIDFVLEEGGQQGDCIYLDGAFVCEILLNEAITNGTRHLSN